MLHYLLKAEDLLKGIFPKISLEILYINLYNLLKLRDVEKIIDNLSRHGGQDHIEAPRECQRIGIRRTQETTGGS